MAFPALANPADVPAHILFPEHYEASRREITRDFVFFGSVIAGGIILAAMLNLAMG